MITLQFCKTSAMVYVSHIDLLRHIDRTLRRMDVPVRYTAGYNPHAVLNMGITLPLGVASAAEYVSVDADVSCKDFLQRYQAAGHADLAAVRCWQLDKNPNLAGKVTAADYFVPTATPITADLAADVMAKSSYIIPYPTRKTPDGEKDIAPLLYDIQPIQTDSGCGIKVCIAAGNTTLKPQLLAQALQAEWGVAVDSGAIVRLGQYVEQDGKRIAVNDYLDGLCTTKASL